MGRYNDIFHLEEWVFGTTGFILKDVETGPRQPPCLKRLNQRSLIHNRPARSIDHMGTGFHQGQFFGIYETLGCRAERTVDRQKVCLPEHVLKTDKFYP